MGNKILVFILIGGFFGSCITGLNSPTTSRTMEKKLFKKEVWEIVSIQITEIEDNITIEDTLMNNLGIFYFFKKEDEGSQFPDNTGRLEIFGREFAIHWDTYSTDKEDPTPNLELRFSEDLAHFNAGKNYTFGNTFWNEEDELHITWAESATSPSLGIHHSLKWEFILRAKD